MKNILGHLRRADQDFGLISDGDKIAIGLSGGKDSLTLVKALSAYQKFGIKKFEIVAITLDGTDGATDFSKIAKFCADHGVEHHVERTQLFKVLFEIRKEKNPCSLCAKMRRGMLNGVAKSHGCNKVALGHHGDDMLETFLLCMFYEGRVYTFQPKSYMDQADITLISPLIYVTEAETIALAKANKFPILKNECPVNGYTKREYMKNMIKKLNVDIPNARQNMLNSITRSKLFDRFDI